MTDRDHFAASALTGLCSMPPMSGPDKPHDFAAMAYAYADAMLRCRGGGDCPSPDNVHCTVNHDAAPAARAPEPEPEPAARRRPAGGTGDTRSVDAYARFAGTVMAWISEATSAYAASCRSDGGRKIMAEACSRCWDAFDRIAYPTDHGASPEARASGDSDRTDKAAPRPSEGTGDTPVAENATTAEPAAWATFYPNGSTASVYVGRKPPHAEPLYRSPTLTDAEREALHWFAHYGLPDHRAATLRGLLERLGGGK